MNKQSNSTVWHLIKVAALWFVLGETATVAANTYDVPATPFAYVAVGAFFLHSFLVMCETSPGKGGNLYSGVITFLLVATVNLMSLRITLSDDFDAVRTRLIHFSEDVSDWVRSTDQAFRNMQAVDHLSAASRLTFQEGTRLSLRQARLHLRRIQPSSREYTSAQGLLLITEGRIAELDSAGGSLRRKKPILEVISRDQTIGRLRVTLRNNGSQHVENIRYKVSYFDTSTGLRIEPDMESVITRPIQPQDSMTLEIPGDILKSPVYAAFIILDWKTDSDSTNHATPATTSTRD